MQGYASPSSTSEGAGWIAKRQTAVKFGRPQSSSIRARTCGSSPNKVRRSHKPVRGRVGLRHGVPARQTGKRRHQRRAAHEVDVSDPVASPLRRHQFPVGRREGLRQGIYLAVLDARPRVLPRRAYFLSAAFFSVGALDADFAIDVVGTMMWAYGVPFHITHGPPLVQSVGCASS